MSKSLTSRERMLRALKQREVDHVPCAFMAFSAMRGRCQDPYEVVEREMAMGLDSMLFIPSAWRNERPNHPDLRGLPVRLSVSVETELWLEQTSGRQFPVLHKAYHTPAGTLTTLVNKPDDWPHGNFVPFVDDYQIPRAIKPLVETRADLDVLRTMLLPPSDTEIKAFRAEARLAHDFRDKHRVLLAGGWGVGADMAAWLCGLENVIIMAVDEPDLLKDLLSLIEGWNARRMRVILKAGVDLYIRRGWYEGTDFWSPRLYKEFLLPIIKREAELAHESGISFGYIMTTGALPLLDSILEAGVDVLIGVDPLQSGQHPLQTMRDKLGGRVCLWGGVNGAITVEEGSADEVHQAVAHVLEVMRGVNGFILSPVDNVTEITLKAWRNVDAFVRTWKQLRRGMTCGDDPA